MKSLLTAIILSFSLESFATTFEGFSCGEIVEYDRDNNKNQIVTISMWFSGYIDGRDFDDYLDTFPDADSQTLYLLLLKECRKKPSISSRKAASIIYERGY
mgnify:CR=1 FL=1